MSRKGGKEERKEKRKETEVWMLRKLGNYGMGNDFGNKMMNLCRTCEDPNYIN